MERNQFQIQQSVMLSAYDKKIVYKIFRNTLEWFEKYVEISYPDYRIDKQIKDDNIKRLDANDPNKIESLFSSILFGFKTMTENKPKFLLDELKRDFYEWVSAIKISADNCPEKLKHYLFEINEILEGRGNKLENDVLNRKRELEPNSAEYGEALNKVFADTLISLENSRNEFRKLEGQNHRDIDVRNNFAGNDEAGKKVFEGIVRGHNYQNFSFFPQNNDSEMYDAQQEYWNVNDLK